MTIPTQHYNLQSAFYDAIFDGGGMELNPLEQETLTNVRAILNDPSQISSHIQPLPVIQIQLLKLMDNPDATYADFADLINQDPALAARVLQIVNSARYASVSEITELESAVASVGMDEIANVASTALMEKIKPPSPIYFKMFGQQIWDHSKQCAQLCKVFAETEGASPSAAYFLGLIHDVGKILIFDCLCKALSGSNYEDMPGGQMFKDVMSEMSLDMSYFVSKEWELPKAFQIALQQQRTGVKSAFAKTLFKANLCAEMKLLLEKKKIDGDSLQSILVEMEIEPAVWQAFQQSTGDANLH